MDDGHTGGVASVGPVEEVAGGAVDAAVDEAADGWKDNAAVGAAGDGAADPRLISRQRCSRLTDTQGRSSQHGRRCSRQKGRWRTADSAAQPKTWWARSRRSRQTICQARVGTRNLYVEGLSESGALASFYSALTSTAALPAALPEPADMPPHLSANMQADGPAAGQRSTSQFSEVYPPNYGGGSNISGGGSLAGSRGYSGGSCSGGVSGSDVGRGYEG